MRTTQALATTEMQDNAAQAATRLASVFSRWPMLLALGVLIVTVFCAVTAPWLAPGDPVEINPVLRLRPPSVDHWLGTDAYGRDVYSRVLYGARVSLIVGLGVAAVSLLVGLFFGLLAIALVSLSGSSLTTVLVAISIPEIPRVVRLVRGVILSVRGEPYVEAARTLGTPVPVLILMLRHLLPNTVAPLIVQCTYIFASAILTEAILSFLGAGIPPEIPSWGNIMAEGRMYFQLIPGLVLYPGLLLSLTVLSVTLLGDALRDALDPRMARRL